MLEEACWLCLQVRLHRQGVDIRGLTVAGNNTGIGETRKEELRGSCESLGIDLARCVALDEAELQDNPTVWWNTDLIQSIVTEYVHKWDIDAVSSLFPTTIIYMLWECH